MVGAWHTVLGFEALCVSSAPNSCGREDFCAIYSMRKTNQDGHFFIPQSGCDKLIVNLVDNVHEWRDTVIRVPGPWEAASAENRVIIPTSWNNGLIFKGKCVGLGRGPGEGVKDVPDWLRSSQLELAARFEQALRAVSQKAHHSSFDDD